MHSQATCALARGRANHWAHNDVDLKHKRDFSDGLFNQSHGSFELAFAPVVLALGGLALDGWLGLTPAFTVFGAVAGTLGAFAKLFYGYRATMADQAARRAEVSQP